MHVSISVTYMNHNVAWNKWVYPKCKPPTIDRVSRWFTATMTTQGTYCILKVVSNRKKVRKTKLSP